MDQNQMTFLAGSVIVFVMLLTIITFAFASPWLIEHFLNKLRAKKENDE